MTARGDGPAERQPSAGQLPCHLRSQSNQGAPGKKASACLMQHTSALPLMSVYFLSSWDHSKCSVFKSGTSAAGKGFRKVKPSSTEQGRAETAGESDIQAHGRR